MKKYCTRCGKQFEAAGREVICPACKQAVQEETKRAAVMRAKRASWTGESVPVRISGRASTVIRKYGAEHNVPFAAALDALLQASDYFKSTGATWESVEPYKSHRRDKHAACSPSQDVQDGTQGKPQDAPQGAPQAAKVAKKVASKATSKASKASKASK